MGHPVDCYYKHSQTRARQTPGTLCPSKNITSPSSKFETPHYVAFLFLFLISVFLLVFRCVHAQSQGIVLTLKTTTETTLAFDVIIDSTRLDVFVDVERGAKKYYSQVNK